MVITRDWRVNRPTTCTCCWPFWHAPAVLELDNRDMAAVLTHLRTR